MLEVPAAEPTFAALLRRYRRAAMLTQEQLAEQSGLSARAVSDLERDDERAPRRDTRDLLAAALALSPADRAALEQAALRTRSQTRERTLSEPPVEAPPRPQGPFLTPLFAQPTAFIGREREIVAIRDRLADPQTRLLTLLGPGGVGKTRLAIEVAAVVRTEFVAGIAFVLLAPLVDPALVLPTTAQALGVGEVSGQTTLQTLAAFLRGKRLLLVFDNLEHLLPAATAVGDLLAHVPTVSALVTSRSALRIRNERVHQVGPLGVPRPPLPALAALSHYEAVRLFIARAQDAQPEFAVTNETAPAVAEICARLDGLPLAIELVAARTRLLEPEALLGRLARRLTIATGGARDLPARQQTMRAAIDWSYSLLDTLEQRLFTRVAVFAGGGTLAAIEGVCDAAQDLGMDVVDGVESLLDKSLLRHEGGGEPRLVMLETIHEYARERLAASGEQTQLEAAHARYYLTLVEDAESHRLGADQGHWLAQLEREHDNLRAVLQWATTRGEQEIGLRVAGALRWFWAGRGYPSEGRQWLEELLAQPGTTASAVRAKALQGAGNLAYMQGDHAQARALYEESLTLSRELGDQQGIAGALSGLGGVADFQGEYAQATVFREESLALSWALGDKHGIAEALTGLGTMALYQSDYAQARALYEESLTLSRDLGDKNGIARTLNYLGIVAQPQGEYAQATLLLEESAALYRELGDKRGMTFPLNNLGVMAVFHGDLVRAAAIFEQGLTVFQELGDKKHTAKSLISLGIVAREKSDLTRATAFFEEGLVLTREQGDKEDVAYALLNLGILVDLQGDYTQATVLYEESLTLNRELGDKLSIAESLEATARMALAPATGRERLQWAARVLGAASALRQAIGAPLPPSGRAMYEHTVSALRTALGEPAWAAAWASGQILTIEQAVDLALSRCFIPTSNKGRVV